MARVNTTHARRTSKRLRRSAQLRCTSSNEDIAHDADNNNAHRDVEEANDAKRGGVIPPSTTVEEANDVDPGGVIPQSTTVQGATTSKKISAIRGWTQKDMKAK